MSRLSDSKDPLLWQQLAGLISAPNENSLNELVRFFAMEFNADSCSLYLLKTNAQTNLFYGVLTEMHKVR